MNERFDAPGQSGWTAAVANPDFDESHRTSGEGDPALRSDLRAAGVVLAVLTVLGALLGLLWAGWSGPQQRAYVIGPHKLYPYDEVETMVAADGRYLVIVLVTGLLAAVLVWLIRPANRGALMLLALSMGGLIGGSLTAWVGHLVGGGTVDGRTGTTIAHLPLSVHMRGLLFIEAGVATLVYGVFVAFAARDDLGRADPVRERFSVRPGDHPQDGRGYGDAAGGAQQSEFPTQ